VRVEAPLHLSNQDARGASADPRVASGRNGIHSTVRALTFGDESRHLRHLGPYAAVWDLPTDMFDHTLGTPSWSSDPPTVPPRAPS
jgi:hypothetical protein